VAVRGFALVWASVGLYALLSYLGSQGNREIGSGVALVRVNQDILGMVRSTGFGF